MSRDELVGLAAIALLALYLGGRAAEEEERRGYPPRGPPVLAPPPKPQPRPAPPKPPKRERILPTPIRGVEHLREIEEEARRIQEERLRRIIEEMKEIARQRRERYECSIAGLWRAAGAQAPCEARTMLLVSGPTYRFNRYCATYLYVCRDGRTPRKRICIDCRFGVAVNG